MKIVYLTPTVANEGGVAKSLSVKTDFFIENFDYSITIITQNNGNQPLFHRFNSRINWDDIVLEGNLVRRFLSYKKSINQKIELINPDVVVVSDNGLKGYLVPILLKTKRPVVFESHGSIWVEEKKTVHWLTFLKSKYKLFLASYFTRFIVLSEESEKEWKLKNCQIIPNSIDIDFSRKAKLESKKVIAIARHSYEKGLDRLLHVWAKIQEIKPDWQLDVYGDFSKNISFIKLAQELQLQNSVHFFEPTKHLEAVYLSSSLLVMTSRTEGFPMAILEANALGLPVIAYDCPVGPRAIIKQGENGLLVENGNQNQFVKQLVYLIENVELRKRMGQKAQTMMQSYQHQKIMNQWKVLFESLTNG